MGSMAKSREPKYLKFPEIQEQINKQIRQYIFDNEISYAELARRLGKEKSRISDLRNKHDKGNFKLILSEKLLTLLVWAGAVDMTKIHYDSKKMSPQKVDFLEVMKDLSKVRRLRDLGYPVSETLDKMLDAAENTQSEEHNNIIKL
jgi:predicted XRE-type DNA-binding protein